MICASVVTNAVGNVDDNINEASDGRREYDNAGDYRSAAGWMIFVAIMGMIIEIVIIIIRILNITIINKNFIIFGFAVSQLFFVCFTNLLQIRPDILVNFKNPKQTKILLARFLRN